jgi:insertion element IS1 protein InsB
MIHKTKTHTISKSETCLVKSKKFLLRNFLARFNRRTSRYSKSIRMIELSVKMLFNKKKLFEIYEIWLGVKSTLTCLTK